MYITTEFHEDSSKHFGFWSDEYKDVNLDISSLSVEAEKVFSNDEAFLIDIQTRFLRKIFKNFPKYKMYILIYRGVSNPVSVVERYKKLWKKLNTQFDFNELIKGEEIEIEVDKGILFCSIAQFDIDNIDIVVKFMNAMSEMCAVIATKSDLMSKEKTSKIINIAIVNNYNRDLLPEVYKVNYEQLCLKLCKNNDFVIRLGNAGEEVSLAVFLNRDLYKNVLLKVNFDEILK